MILGLLGHMLWRRCRACGLDYGCHVSIANVNVYCACGEPGDEYEPD